jgi:ubiquinol-cytochrome c reductase cytochrome b subunit
LIFFFVVLAYPFKLGDPEIFMEADLLTSPVHIVPEWYFLFAYAILRAVPNKALGVFLLLISIISFLFFNLLNNYLTPLKLINKLVVFDFFNIFFCCFGIPF